MNREFGIRKDHVYVSNPQKCSLCNRIFLTPQDLISHSITLHSNHHVPTFYPAAARPTTFRHQYPNRNRTHHLPAAAGPTTFRHQYPNSNRNPNPSLSRRNRFPLNYYRSGHIEEQRRYLNGFPANTPANNSNFLCGQQEKAPKLMNLFPAMSSESSRTLPLIRQLEQRIPQDTVTENNWAIPSPIDLTLRL